MAEYPDWDLYGILRRFQEAANPTTASATNTNTTPPPPPPPAFTFTEEFNDEPFSFPNDILEPLTIFDEFDEELNQLLLTPSLHSNSTTNTTTSTGTSTTTDTSGDNDGININSFNFAGLNTVPPQSDSLVVQNRRQHKQQNQQPPPLVQKQDFQVQSSARARKRKREQKKKVCHVGADDLSSLDMWAWRKYGQKPIKNSPYPRSYYRCSSSTGCDARKLVEQSNTQADTFVVTYTGDHSHPKPTHYNPLAGTTRQRKVISASSSSCSNSPPSSSAPPVVGSSRNSSDELDIEIGDYIDEADLWLHDLHDLWLPSPFM